MQEQELDEAARTPAADARGASAAAPGSALPTREAAKTRETSDGLAGNAGRLSTLFAVPPHAARTPEPEGLFLDPPTLGVAERASAEPRYNLLQRAVRRVRGLFQARISIAFLVQASLAFTVAHFLLFNLSVVRGSSMQPGIHDGDRIVIDPFAYLFGQVERGDVVVLKYPLDPSVDYIKRVIGLPGDEVVIESGVVWVNGVALDEPYVSDADPLSRSATRVKPAHFFVLGDNRPRSSDSRDFGQVPAEYVRGRVEVRLWPFDRAGAVR